MMSEISTTHYQLIIRQHCCSNFGRRAFSVVGPMTWNCVRDNLHYPTLSDKFKVALKTHLYSEYQNRGVLRNRALNALRLTYLLVLRCVTHGIISVWLILSTHCLQLPSYLIKLQNTCHTVASVANEDLL